MFHYDKFYDIIILWGLRMESLTIKDHEKYLRQISKEVQIGDKELTKDIATLKEYCNSHDCFAMAAVQLGIPKRLVYINSTNPTSTNVDESIILINPVVLEKKGKTEFWEACMSCLDNFGLVERPYAIKLKYTAQSGENKICNFEGFAATVISHELDHLDGIFHMDRAKKLVLMNKEERLTVRKKYPYKIISKVGDFEYPQLNNLEK